MVPIHFTTLSASLRADVWIFIVWRYRRIPELLFLSLFVRKDECVRIRQRDGLSFDFSLNRHPLLTHAVEWAKRERKENVLPVPDVPVRCTQQRSLRRISPAKESCPHDHVRTNEISQRYGRRRKLPKASITLRFLLQRLFIKNDRVKLALA